MPEFILNHEAMTHARAAEVAAAWGSMMNASDPGAIFYTFDGVRRPAWSDAQQSAALAYCNDCLLQARGAGSGPTDADKVAADVADLEALRRYIRGTNGATFETLDELTAGFIEAAFFAETSPAFDRDKWDSDECQSALAEGQSDGNLPGDACTGDIDPESLELVKAFCADFQTRAADALAEAYRRGDYDAQQAGRDLYFSRTGSGVGFWSRGELYRDDLGQHLTELAGSGAVDLSFDTASGVSFHIS